MIQLPPPPPLLDDDQLQFNHNDNNNDDDDDDSIAASSFHSSYEDHLFVSPTIKTPGSLRQYLEKQQRQASSEQNNNNEYHYNEHHYDRKGPRNSCWDSIVRIFAILILPIAMTASFYVADSCEFLSIHGDETSTNALLPHPLDDIPGDVTVYVGIFGYAPESDTYCESYMAMFQSPTLKGTTHDGSWNIFFILSQWCAVSAPVFALLAWFMICFSCCIRSFTSFSCSLCCCTDTFQLGYFLCYMAALLQLGTFSEYLQHGLCYDNHDRDCQIEFFGYISFATSFVYFLCGFLLWMAYNPIMKENLDLCMEMVLPSYRQKRKQHRRRKTKQRLRSSFSSDVVSIDSLDSMDSRDFEVFQKNFFGRSSSHNGNNNNKKRNKKNKKKHSTRTFGASSHHQSSSSSNNNNNNNNNRFMSAGPRTFGASSHHQSSSSSNNNNNNNNNRFMSAGPRTSFSSTSGSAGRDFAPRNPGSNARLQRAAERRKRTSIKIRTLEQQQSLSSENKSKSGRSVRDYDWKSTPGSTLVPSKASMLDDNSQHSMRSQDIDAAVRRFSHAISSGGNDSRRSHHTTSSFMTADEGRSSFSSHNNNDFHDEIYHSDDDAGDDNDEQMLPLKNSDRSSLSSASQHEASRHMSRMA
eukprot:CAMPEP_0119571964 /NCGR_PEP_ID=MMETSP1352-20130426/44385_1 /TAXON_ID=265584 /ORGANISM="Stauroneis constricta, Strain CCMP1120" /LENGTH=636 /DNA_ID=CAMNT_0007621647 /DNA_START=299 /DNA_END=2209 /DNA_ORIENTATION=+